MHNNECGVNVTPRQVPTLEACASEIIASRDADFHRNSFK